MKKIKKIILAVFILTLLAGCKKTSPENTDANIAYPIITPPGAATGEAISKKIGTDGGSIISSDGNVELIFPSGALNAETEIVIQAVTNNLPNGINNAYNFSPGNVKFIKAVTVKFHYSDQDAAATLPDLMGIAFQDSIGGWWRINSFTNDPVKKIISAPIWHFSTWAAFDMMLLIPTNASIAVNKTLGLEVQVLSSDDDFLVDDLRSPDQVAPLQNISHSTIIWSANGVVNGNSTTGILTNSSIPGTVGAAAVYTSPAKAPQQNPVAVSAEVDTKFKYHGKVFDKTTLISNITITGNKYLLEIREEKDELTLGIWIKDSASMVVDMGGSSVVISDIRNFDAVIQPPNSASGSGCTFTCVNTGPGDINITSATGEMRIGTDTRAVQIFYTHTGTIKYQYHQYCPLPTGGAYEATSEPGPTDGNPLSNFFDLSEEVNEDNLDAPFIKIYAKLTLIK